MASSLVNNKYRITRRIGGGSFGEIYMGIGPNNEKVAVKFERHGTRCPQLRHEYKVYRELTNCHGFCSVYHFGIQDNYNVMVMDLLGPSLEDLFNKCSRRFSLKTVLQIADQMLERVDTLHSRHLIHRDIKPANFVIGVGDNAANVFCVDFGLSKRYRHPKNLHHIPHRDGRSLTGTPRYASINNHLGIEQSRRDDLESIGYVLIYFLKGTLPWQGLKAKNAQKKYRLILEKKQQVSIAQLCQGCPSQFAEFLAYTRSLKFDAKPDIPYLRKLFRDLYHAQGCGSIPKLWDWDNMEGNDFLSVGGSGTGPAPVQSSAAIGQGTNMMSGAMLSAGLRPTTAAAVASSGAGAGLESDHLLGNSAPDDLDVDYEMRQAGNDRPNTAGVLYNRGAGASGAQNQGATWGYSRQPVGDPSGGNVMGKGVSGPTLGNGGMDNYGTDGGAQTNAMGQRRPHTAHGGRAGFPSSSAPITSGYGGDPSKQGTMYSENGGEEDDHVVAGARGMMRYRRSQPGGGTNSGSNLLPQQQLLPSQGIGYGVGANAGNNGGAPWAMYQNNGKPVGNMPAANGSNLNNNGWPAYASDRPKSANFTGSSTNNAGSGGLMTSLTGQGRPSSSQQATGNTNWAAQQQAHAQAQAQQNSANSNTLSYGSLKNRFLSGASKNNGVGTGTASGAPQSGAGGATGSRGGSSKLFSLAR